MEGTSNLGCEEAGECDRALPSQTSTFVCTGYRFPPLSYLVFVSFFPAFSVSILRTPRTSASQLPPFHLHFLPPSSGLALQRDNFLVLLIRFQILLLPLSSPSRLHDFDPSISSLRTASRMSSGTPIFSNSSAVTFVCTGPLPTTTIPKTPLQ